MSVRILTGDCRAMLATLPDESVHCVVTSPPYFGLRDYGTAQWEGGDKACEHKASNYDRGERAERPSATERMTPFRSECGKCGARRIDAQIGLEPTPDAYVAELVAVFSEVRRVLRKDGTLWLNLGDSYAGGGGFCATAPSTATSKSGKYGTSGAAMKSVGNVQGIKPKDLIGIPWRVAFALQADGWWLRQDIIWSKPNPMPESVTDRCTKAHEYLFLLAKSKQYFYDALAIAEPAIFAGKKVALGEKSLSRGQATGANVSASGNGLADSVTVAATRNKRSVWHIATQHYSGAHFATFPPALIEPCILAGCPHKCCAKCGAPWVREQEIIEHAGHKPRLDEKRFKCGSGPHPSSIKEFRGFSPSCSCNVDTVSGTCLDPFGGAGTTGLVADRLQRNAILIELNPKYVEMARHRIDGDVPLFADREDLISI